VVNCPQVFPYYSFITGKLHRRDDFDRQASQIASSCAASCALEAQLHQARRKAARLGSEEVYQITSFHMEKSMVYTIYQNDGLYQYTILLPDEKL
jgi:hypothetical protein